MNAGEAVSGAAALWRRRVTYGLTLGVKVAISGGLIVWLLRSIDLGLMVGYFRELHWAWLVAAIALHQLQGVLSALKWQVILAADGQRLGLFFLFKTYQIANFLSLFLPTSFGGDVYRTWAVNRTGVRFSKSTASVLFDRLSGLFALLSIGVVGGVLLLPANLAGAIIAAYLLGGAAFFILTSDHVVSRLPQPKGKYLGFPILVLRSFNIYRQSRAAFLRTVALSACFQFNVVVIVFCYARSLGIPAAEITFLEMVAVVPVIFLSEVLPAINGIGVRDGAFVFFFTLVGSTAEKAMAVSLMVLLMRYLKSFVVGAIWMGDILRKPEGAVVEASPTHPVSVAPQPSTLARSRMR
jgi:uncharacterized membrane protein YbhN (UPF0104 family)